MTNNYELHHISELEKIADDTGSFWFKNSSAHGSRPSQDVYKVGESYFFVDSTKDKYSNRPRAYTALVVTVENDEGHRWMKFRHVGDSEIEQFATSRQAWAFIRKHIATLV